MSEITMHDSELSRRTFVKGAAAALAAAPILATVSPALANDAPADTSKSESAALDSAASYTPGTYTATGAGRNGDIVLEITFDESTITKAEVIEQRETELIGTEAISRMLDALVADQHLTIDTVSGATLTSAGVRAAVIDCIEQATGDVEALTSAVEPEVFEDTTCDVVVVGAGGAGMTGAVELARQGLDVILIEKTDLLGGTTTLSSTYILGFGTKEQIAQACPATADDFVNLIVPKRLTEVAPDAVQSYVDLVPETLDGLAASGADLSRIIDGMMELGPADGGTIGSQIVPAVVKQLEESDCEYRLGHAIDSLIVEDGRVVGVVAKSKGGTYEIRAKAVLMAFGGYISSPDLVAQYHPEYVGLGSTWTAASTGEGLQMCIDAGGSVGGMEGVVINPTGYAVNGLKVGMVSFSPFRYNGCILVGRSTGARFANELSDYTAVALAMPEGLGYAIFDQAVFDSSATIQEYFDLGYFQKADTVEELAEKLDLDPAVFAQTMATYAEAARSGTDSEFGRTSMLSDLTTAPFYGAPVERALHNAVGGVVTDAYGRALDGTGSAIPGLYVAGNAADNTLVPNVTSGCMIYTRVIAQAIAEDLR